MITKTAFDLCAFFVLAVCFFTGCRWKREYVFQRKVLLGFIGLNMILALMSILNQCILYYGWKYGDDALILLEVTKTIAYICNAWMPAVFSSYILCVAGIARARKKLFYYIFYLPYIVCTILVLTNPWHHKIFHYVVNRDYYRGPLASVLFFSALFYVITGVYFLVRYQKAMERQRMFGMVSAIMIAVVFATIQYRCSYIRVELMGVTLACLAMLLNVEFNMNDIDTRSGCFNRRAFQAMVRRNAIAKSHYFMVSVRFTNISNDLRQCDEDTETRMLQYLGGYFQKLNSSLQIYYCNHGTFILVLVNKEERYHERLIKDLVDMFGNGEFEFENLKLPMAVEICQAHVPEELSYMYEINEFVDFKGDGEGGQFQLYDAAVLENIRRENAVRTALQSAIAERRLDVVIQPIVDLKTGKIIAGEALTRLRDPALGMVYPGEFIPIAEGSNLIVELGEYVLEEVCKLLQNHAMDAVEYVEINLAPYQILQSDLTGRFMEIMNRYGVGPERINLEITEMVASDDRKNYSKTLRELRKAGFTFSLDDFGTGYSNLARLFHHKFRNIKIDKSLLWDSSENEIARDFLEGMIQTIHHMDALIIQEGVETREQLEYVKAQGVDYVQGYIFSKPMEIQDFIDYITE